MLVLTRKKGESIVFPGLEIRLTVTSIRGDKVRIGIESPEENRIYRTEVLERIEATKKEETPI